MKSIKYSQRVKKKRLWKSFVLLFFSVLLLLNYGHAQDYHYLSSHKDVIQRIHVSAFQYINCYVNEINIKTLKRSIHQGNRCIFYRIYDSSKTPIDAIINYPFKNIIRRSLDDNGVIALCTNRMKLKFKYQKTLSDFTKVNCYLDLFPLVTDSKRIYLKAMLGSIGVGDDEIIGYLYFIFNSDLQLLKVESEDVIL